MIQRNCINCGSERVHEVIENDYTIYYCASCDQKSGRSLQSDGRMIIKKIDDQVKHVSVGAIIEDRDKILLVDRRTFPYAFSIVAGHMEYGEKPEEALKREVLEETGIEPMNVKLLLHEDIRGDKCRHGVNIHEWYLFKIDYKNEPIRTSNEHRNVLWYGKSDLGDIPLTFAAKFLLTKTGLIKNE